MFKFLFDFYFFYRKQKHVIVYYIFISYGQLILTIIMTKLLIYLLKNTNVISGVITM